MLDWLADTLLGRSLNLRRAEIAARKPQLFLGSGYHITTQFRLVGIGAPDTARRWQNCLFTIELDGFHLYPQTRQWDIHVLFPPESLRWFGRPEKYHSGTNEIWLHLETETTWQLLKLRTTRHMMQSLVRVLKQVATPEQVTAYRRCRPYVHYGPAPAQQAIQTIHGAWQVEAPLTLYLTPCALVLLNGEQVRRVLPLEQLQQVEVMRRMDAPQAGGVVRFNFNGSTPPEPLAFTLPDYIPFGAALVEAARRSLEDPPLFYGKKKDEDDDDY